VRDIPSPAQFDIVIRPGGPADLAAVAAIQAASPLASQWKVEEYLGRPFFVATVDEEVAGFLIGQRLAEGESEILNVAVGPKFRRTGVGRRLVEAWLHHAPGDVYLEVRESNHEARKFYEVLGFEAVGVRPSYYEAPIEPAIVLKFHSC
jgi:ribosomal protein S18 acetylase RimI-like enzyme